MFIDLKSLLALHRIDANFAVAEAVIDHKEEILKKNDNQLDKGLDSENKDLGEYKNFKYKNRFRPVDLKLTGEFRAEEDILADNTEMVFIDPNEKTLSLMSRYGNDILGLSEEDQAGTAEMLLPYVIDNINTQLA